MRTFTKLWILLLLQLHLAGSAVADIDSQEAFSRSLEASCLPALAKKAVADYSKMTGIVEESIPAEVRKGLEDAFQPFQAACNCAARKALVNVQSESEKKVDIDTKLIGLAIAAECAPEPAVVSAVRRSIERLVEASPPPVRSIKIKRTPFTLELTLNKTRASVFATYTRPPPGLTKIVFLAPATGTACDPQDVCVDKSPLKIVNTKELLLSDGRVLGEEGLRNLQRVVDRYGEDARFVTSGSNFANFAKTTKGANYAIRSIDGVPIEKTTAKKVWLVIFASQVPADPRAIDFAPAGTSIFEVEFAD